MHLSLCLSFLIGKRKVCVASVAYAAVGWVHGILPLQQNSLDSGFCRNLVEAEKQASTDLIKAIVSRYGQESATLKDLRVATMCAVSFAGRLFRSKELLSIRICDIKLLNDHIIIHVPSSKDQCV